MKRANEFLFGNALDLVRDRGDHPPRMATDQHAFVAY